MPGVESEWASLDGCVRERCATSPCTCNIPEALGELQWRNITSGTYWIIIHPGEALRSMGETMRAAGGVSCLSPCTAAARMDGAVT